MKLLFLFMSGSKGFGGHHVSAKELVNALNKKGQECHVMCFGAKSSIVFSDYAHLYHFNISPFSLKQRSLVSGVLKEKNFDAYIPMDETSCRILCSIYPSALSYMIPIKPGWINVDSWINLTSDFVCFSKENFDYMNSLGKYKDVKVHLIPNRVSCVSPDDKRIELLKKKYNILPEDKLLLAVSRIDPDKTSVFYSAINLYKKLKENDSSIKLMIIGSVSSQETLKEITSLDSVKFDLVTDAEYTTNVSRLFKCAYALVGMGRTAMESLSFGVPTFVPNRNSELPIMISNNTFELLLEANFTYRAKLDDKIHKANDLIIDQFIKLYDFLCAESKNIFIDKLEVDKGTTKYLEIINSIQNNSRNLLKELRAYFYSNIRWGAGYFLKKKLK